MQLFRRGCWLLAFTLSAGPGVFDLLGCHVGELSASPKQAACVKANQACTHRAIMLFYVLLIYLNVNKLHIVALKGRLSFSFDLMQATGTLFS